ncbi:hypothetical protein NG798_09715, partial [Ancylothrix sp. C2]|uniref:phycobilisome linker polypeptide n=1 Tax=Ancylothrix sp. D3o TaxID=2953691 RepID=UPI0029500281
MLGISTTGFSSSSNYNNRIFYVEVQGLGGNDLVRTSHYTLTVPYSQLSKTMQRINRQGGHIVSVRPESALHLTEPLADYLSGVPALALQPATSSDVGDAEMSKVDEPAEVISAEPETTDAKVDEPAEVISVEPDTTEAKAEEPAEVISAEPETTEAKVDEPAEVISVEPETTEAKAEEPAEVISVEPDTTEAKA